MRWRCTETCLPGWFCLSAFIAGQIGHNGAVLRPLERLALLGLTIAATACQQHYTLPIEAPSVSSTQATFAWEGTAAREVTVYRCRDACPAIETLPRYGQDEDVPADIVWDIAGVDSPANGAGTIASPLTYGDVDHENVYIETPAAELVPGRYLLRVVTFDAVRMKANIGTGWTAFIVPDDG